MAGGTNRGKFEIAGHVFRAVAIPGNGFAVALIIDTPVPDPDTNVFTDITEITAGNGYVSGGISLNRNATDFDVITEDDTNDRSFVQIRDLVWTAAGGPIPSAGSPARRAVFTDQNATVSLRNVWGTLDLVMDRVVSDTQTLTLADSEIALTE